jgi:hypothetical protein
MRKCRTKCFSFYFRTNKFLPTIRRSSRYTMKKLILSSVVLCLHAITLLSQGTWTFAAPTDGAGSAGAESARAICVDASGNTYVVGNFNGAGVATDFNLNSSFTNTFTASTADGFIASYDKNGNFRWKTIITGTGADFNAPAGAVCTNGTYVWVAGSANVSTGAASIQSSTNTVTITSPGAGVDAFVAKMNCSNGSVVWQQGFGGAGSNDFAMGICADPNGCVYVSGAYSGTFTLGSVTFPAFAGTISDVYIAKFTPSGVCRSVQTGGSTVQDNINAGSGLCYVPGATPAIVATGHTGAATAAFGPFVGLTNAGLFDAYLVELDTALFGFTNAMVFGSAGSDELLSAVYDPFSGGVFVSGFCSGNITFPGTAALTGLGAQDIVIARYSVSANNFVWSSIAGGAANDRGWCVAADGYGGILLSGYSQGACSFSGSVFMPPNAGLNDLYVTRYNTAGTPVWVQTAISAGTEEARSIASYVETTPSFTSTIFVTGITNGATVPFGSTNVGNDGGNDFFLAKINDASALVPLTATQSQVNLTCNGVCNGSATVVASGGTAPYTYSWAPSGGSAATASSLCAGTYTCTITDANSTTITRTFNITQPPAITLNANTQTNVSCFGGSNGAASVVPATGGAGGYTYNWTPGNPTGDGTVSVSGLTAATWTCTVTDANSCTTTRTFTITQPSAIIVTPASQTNISCNGGGNGAASINTPTGGAGGYTYNWTPGNPTGDGTVSVSGLTAGSWTCTVTDANSCTATQTFNITQPTALVVSALSQTNVSCFGGNNGAASVTVSGGVTAYSYNWTPGNPTGDGTASVTGLTTGSWTCTVTDANSCVATRTFNITSPTALVVTPASQTNISCFGGSNGAASINTPTGGAGGYTYNWTPGNPTGDGTVSVTGLTAGTWTCTVTDANSCTATQTFNITAPTAIVVTPASQTNISCNGGSNGAASINTPTGGAGGFTYNWTPGNPTGDGTVSVTGLTAGTWTCTVTDANSCTATQTFNITQPTAITASISSTPTSCTANTGTATVSSVSGGAGSYTYSWAPSGGTAATATSLAGGTYTCTITDANSCAITRTVTVSSSSGPTLTAQSQTNVSCFGGSNGAAAVNAATGGTSPYTYNWTPGNPTGDGTTSVTGLTAGSWTCTVTDAGGCTASVTFNITSPTAIVVTAASQTNISCNGGANGAASINTPTGGAGGYTYNWTPGNPTGDGTVSVTGLTAGTWTCTVTDANACTASQTFNITQPTALVVTAASQTNISCNGGTNGAAAINTPTGGAGGYTYNWTPGNPTGDGTVSVTGLTAGTWTCTVTDANACTATQTFNITQPTALVLTAASQTNISCNGGSNGAAAINTPTGGAGGYTYNWTPGNPTGDGTVSVTGLNAGTWTCTVTDANSCTATQTFNITQPTAIVVTAASQTNISCNGGSNGAAAINTPTGGAGGYSYNWTPGNPTGDGTVSVTGLTAGTWTCTVTDANSCTATQTFNITQPTAIVLNANTQTNISCFGGTNGAASVTPATGGAGGYTYNWTPGNPTGDGTVSVTGLTAGTWTCTVTDANSCTATRTFSITSPAALVVTPASQTNILCNGGSNGAASVTVSGGTTAYSYNWTPGNPTGDGTASVTGLTAGTWTCTVTDANSCTAAATFSITAPTAIVASISSTPTACTSNTGTATVSGVSGGAGSYTYSWAPSGGTSATATALAAGTYTCTITDANACTITRTVTVGGVAAPTLTPLSQTNVSCFGGSNGAACVNAATGGTAPYTYNWTPGNPTGDGTTCVTGLTAGTWTCTVTDANGCTAVVVFNITSPSAIVLTATATPTVICAGQSSVLSASATGGSGSFSYVWTPGNIPGSSTTVSPTVTTTYTVAATDANGCNASTALTVSVNPLPAVALSGTNHFCPGGSTLLTGTSGGTSQWYLNGVAIIGANNNTYLATLPGVYNMRKTNLNGCGDSAAVGITVTVDTPPTIASVTSSPVLCFGNSNGSATVTAIGTPTLSYSWAPTGGTSATASSLSAGNYTVTVTDGNTCTSTATVAVTSPTAITTLTSQVNTTCFGGNDASASVAVTGGTIGYTYLWTPVLPPTPSNSNLSAGSYSCLVTDANGCTSTATFNITEPALITSAQSVTICNGDSVVVGTSAYYTAGTYIDTLASILGCDSVVTTSLAVNPVPSVISVTSAAVCDSGAVTLGASASGGANLTWYSDSALTVNVSTGNSYATPMLYTTTTFYVQADSAGCYSAAVPVTVTVNTGAVTINQSITLCFGDSVTIGANTYFSSGVYADTINFGGCDSIFNSTITVLNQIMASQTLTICSGQSVTVGANTYTATGIYMDTLAAVNGCDSLVTTDLTVTLPDSSAQTVTVCNGDSYSIGSNIYSASGVYNDTLTNINGCDSVVTTTLTVLPANVFSQNITLCAGDSIIVGTNVYNAAGTYNDTLADVNGCDSLITTVVTVNTVDVSVSVTNFGGTLNSNASGPNTSWIWFNCEDNTTIISATMHSYSPNANGQYAVIVTQNGCQDTSTCFNFNTVGITEQVHNAFGMYPNPASDNIIVESTIGSTIVIFDAIGNQVFASKATSSKTEIALTDLSNGIYFVKVISDNNESTQKLIISK